MKKTTVIITVIAMLGGIAGCNKYVPQYEWNKNKQEEEKPIEDPQGDVVNKTFSATLQNGEFATSDEISIIWGASEISRTTALPSAAGKTASFTAAVVDTDDYFALYPSSVVGTYIGGKDISVTVQDVQSGIVGTADIEGAYSDKTAAKFDFKSLVSIIKFKITRDDVAQISIKATNGVKIAGKLAVSFDTEGSFSSSVSDGKAEVKVPSETLTATVSPGEFEIAVSPAYLADGFTINCRDMEGKSVVAPFVSDALDLKAGESVDLGEVDKSSDDFITEYFVRPEGSGDKSGKSWDNALDIAGFKEIVANPLAVEGFPFHFAAGKYILADASTKYYSIAYPDETSQVSFQLFGGYPSTATGKDLTGRNVASFETVFSGNKSYSGVFVGKQTNILFDGIVFEDAVAVSDNLSSIRGALGVDSKTATVRINDCTFRNNIEDGGTATGSHGGAAIFIKTGKVYVNNSFFTGNESGSRGGAININNADGQLFMNGCSFVGNSITKDSYGMVIFCKANVGINGCTFYNNTDKVESKNNPSINTNWNVILTNNTIVEDSSFSTGTGVIRSETLGSDGYVAMMMNNIVVNTHPEDASNVAWSVLFSKVGLISKGCNILCAKDGGISHSDRFTPDASDKNVTSLAELGTSYTYNTVTHRIDWSAPFANYTAADASTVRAAIEAVSPTAGYSTIGTDFAAWLESVGAF